MARSQLHGQEGGQPAILVGFPRVHRPKVSAQSFGPTTNHDGPLETNAPSTTSFAWMEMNLCLAKLIFRYDWELVDETLDWEAASRSYLAGWRKAPIYVKFHNRL